MLPDERRRWCRTIDRSAADEEHGLREIVVGSECKLPHLFEPCTFLDWIGPTMRRILPRQRNDREAAVLKKGTEVAPRQIKALITPQRSEEHTSELQSLTNLVC